jgi:hypothetical protein
MRSKIEGATAQVFLNVKDFEMTLNSHLQKEGVCVERYGFNSLRLRYAVLSFPNQSYETCINEVPIDASNIAEVQFVMYPVTEIAAIDFFVHLEAVGLPRKDVNGEDTFHGNCYKILLPPDVTNRSIELVWKDVESLTHDMGDHVNNMTYDEWSDFEDLLISLKQA